MDDLRTKAYKIIKQKIITCEILPGELIDLNDLVQQIGTSRTPVRDAIFELSQEKLVDIYPRRGVFASILTIDDVKKIYDIRRQLEPFIVKTVTPSINKPKLEEFREYFSSELSEQNKRRYCQADFDFHMFLAQSTENEYIMHVMDMVLCHNMRFVIRAAEIPKRLMESNIEHIKVIEAMLEGDENQAFKLMTKHIEKAMNSSTKSIL